MKGIHCSEVCNIEDFYIWVVEAGKPMYFANFDVYTVPFSIYSPPWEDILRWGLEVQEILDNGIKMMPRYIKSMPDPLWDWIGYICTHEDIKKRFRENMTSSIVPKYNVSCGSIFARMQIKLVAALWNDGSLAERFVKKAGPSVAFCAAEWYNLLTDAEKSIAQNALKAEDVQKEIAQLNLPEPRYKYNKIMERRWADAVLLLLC